MTFRYTFEREFLGDKRERERERERGSDRYRGGRKGTDSGI
jgi:hypothetical protein